MIDFDKVLEHVGGFGKYQITSKLCQIASPCRRTPKRAILDGPRPDYLRVGMNGSLIKCPVNFRTRDFQKLFSLGYGNIHTYKSEALIGITERKGFENESGSDPTGSKYISRSLFSRSSK